MTSNISVQTTIDIAAIVSRRRKESQVEGSPANRQDLADALRSAYAAQGMTDVSPEMIEKAIDEYYGERLKYKGFQGGFISRMLGAAYLLFFAHRVLYTSLAIAAIVLACSLNYIQAGMKTASNSLLARQFTTIANDMAKINVDTPAKLADRQAWLTNAQAVNVAIAKPAYDSLLQSYAKVLVGAQGAYMNINKQVGQGFPQPSSAQVATDPEKYRAQSKELQDSYSVLQAVLAEQFTALDGLQGKTAALVAVEKSYIDLVKNPDYQPFISSSEPALLRSGIERSLAGGDTQIARQQISVLGQNLALKSKHQALVSKAEDLMKSYAGVFNYRESKESSQALFAQATFAANQDDAAGLNTIASQLSVLKTQEAQAALDLTIRVVDRPDVITGTARKFDQTGNKRYYLIMEAVNRAGIAQQRLIYNQETKKTELVPYWGQEVAEATFRKVAADKKIDGIVDDRDFGRKPAGTYTPIFDRPVLGGTITRWPDKE
jgi:hypothetical protein